MPEITGGSLTGVTVSTKLVLTPPKFVSRTDTVTVAEPDWLVAGVMVSVRFVPVPLNAKLFGGSKVEFTVKALTVSKLAAVWASLMTNGIAIGVSSRMVRLVIVEMVGAVLADGLT